MQFEDVSSEDDWIYGDSSDNDAPTQPESHDSNLAWGEVNVRAITFTWDHSFLEYNDSPDKITYEGLKKLDAKKIEDRINELTDLTKMEELLDTRSKLEKEIDKLKSSRSEFSQHFVEKLVEF